MPSIPSFEHLQTKFLSPTLPLSLCTFYSRQYQPETTTVRLASPLPLLVMVKTYFFQEDLKWQYTFAFFISLVPATEDGRFVGRFEFDAIFYDVTINRLNSSIIIIPTTDRRISN